MITLRYHLVSLVAVFLALTIGVVLGSTSVSQRLLSVVAGDRSNLTEQVDQLSAQRDQLAAQQRTANAFGNSVAASVVKGRLSGRKVVLVVAPDTDPVNRDATRQLLADSGAAVTGELDLSDAILDPARADTLRDLTTRLLPAGAQLPSTSDSGGLVGGLLGSVLLTPKPGTAASAPGQTGAALGGLVQAGFVRPGPAPAQAQLVVVLSGGAEAGAYSAARAATLARIAGELNRAGGGAVLAGTSGSETGTGAVGVARADSSISAKLSTVDDLQDASGRVATVLALRERADGRTGHYGSASGAQGPIPGATAG
jgi:hypothetical protein